MLPSFYCSLRFTLIFTQQELRSQKSSLTHFNGKEALTFAVKNVGCIEQQARPALITGFVVRLLIPCAREVKCPLAKHVTIKCCEGQVGALTGELHNIAV